MQIRDYLIIYTLIFNHSQNRNLKTQSKVQNSCFILFLQIGFYILKEVTEAK